MTPKEVMAPLAALAGEHDGGNNTTVNRYFGWNGAAYCGLSVRYAFTKSGHADALALCPNSAYVPTLLAFCKKYWKSVSVHRAEPGDVFIYRDDHTGFIWDRVGGTTVITLEGNAMIWPTAEEAKKSATGSGLYEGIGYKRRELTSAYTVWRPPYSDEDQYGPVAYNGQFHLLREGDSGPEVKIVQRLLYSRFGRLVVTGDYARETADEVRRGQELTGCKVDGEVGEETWPAFLYRL